MRQLLFRLQRRVVGNGQVCSSLSYSECNFPSCSMTPLFGKRLIVQSGFDIHVSQAVALSPITYD